MNYRNVNRVRGSRIPAYYLGRPRSVYREESVPAVPLSIVWRADVVYARQLAA